MRDSELVVRKAYEALARGDLHEVLDLVDPDLEWTFLRPDLPDPEPEVCHGRQELAQRLGAGSELRRGPQLEELVAYGERVLVVTRSPGLDERRARTTGDRNFHVVTVVDGRIKALRACRSREEAATLAAQTGEG